MGDQSYSGWSIVGAETISGINRIFWKSSDGKFHRWDLDSNWRQIGGKSISGDLLYESEYNFQQDFNGDSLIRTPNSLFTPKVINYEMHDLLSRDFSKHIVDWVGDSERVNYYLHDSAGFKYDHNTKSNIYTHRYDSSEINFVENIFNYVDRNIDLDFTRVFDRNLANIEITKADDNAKLLGDSKYLGYAQISEEENRVWMDLWWKNIVPNNRDNKYTEYSLLSERESHTIVHEIGHALGLAHPRNDPFGKWHNSNDTIMSYNVEQLNGNKSLNFSDADISTLELVYGKEDDGNTSQNKIPNNAERRSLLKKLSHNVHASKKTNHKEDELI